MLEQEMAISASLHPILGGTVPVCTAINIILPVRVNANVLQMYKSI